MACGGLLLALTILLYNGAVVVVGSVYLLAFDQMGCHALVAAALAGAIAHALYLTRDRGDASTGGWLVARIPVRARPQRRRARGHAVDIHPDLPAG